MAVIRKNISKANQVDRDWLAGKVTLENISENYSLSASYYQQKEIAFKNFWTDYLQRAKQISVDEFLQKATEKTMKDYSEITKTWVNIYDSLDKGLTTIEKEEKTKEIFIDILKKNDKFQNIMAQSKELSDWANGINKEKNIFSILGFTTENLLENNFAAIANNGVSNLMMQISSTGKMKGNSLITTGKRNVRSDIAIYPSSLELNYENAGLINKTSGEKLTFEAEVDFSLDDVLKVPLPDTELLQSFEEYLNGDFAGAGGIIVKTYSLQKLEDKNFAKFSESIPLQSTLNDLLSTANYTRGYLTQDFVDVYIIYYLSKLIQYIVSPIAIGFVNKDGFVWMSRFLETYRFYMRNKRGAKEGRYSSGKDLGKKWYKYNIPSPVIQIYNKNRTKAQFLTRINKYSYRYASGYVTSKVF